MLLCVFFLCVSVCGFKLFFNKYVFIVIINHDKPLDLECSTVPSHLVEMLEPHLKHAVHLNRSAFGKWFSKSCLPSRQDRFQSYPSGPTFFFTMTVSVRSETVGVELNISIASKAMAALKSIQASFTVQVATSIKRASNLGKNMKKCTVD